MIITDKISLTNKLLFNIMVITYLKKRWWMFAWIWIMIVILFFRENTDSFGYFIIVALLFIQFIMAYQFWSNANSNENKRFLQDKHYEIDTDKIVGFAVDGLSTTIETRFFISVVKTSNYYLLYTTRIDFTYIPINSFKSKEDREWFEREIVENIK